MTWPPPTSPESETNCPGVKARPAGPARFENKMPNSAERSPPTQSVWLACEWLGASRARPNSASSMAGMPIEKAA